MTMPKERIYDLRGLKIIFAAITTQLIMTGIGAFLGEILLLQFLFVLIWLAIYVAIFIGTIGMSSCNGYFQEAKKMMILLVILEILQILAALGNMAAAESGIMMTRSITRMQTISAILMLKYVYDLLQGCQMIGHAEQDYDLSDRCRRAWPLYLTCIIASVVISFIIMAFPQILVKNLFLFLGTLTAEIILGMLADVFILRAIHKTYCLYEGKAQHGFY